MDFHELQKHNQPEDLVLNELETKPEQIPRVYPCVVKTEFFKGQAAIRNDKYQLCVPTPETKNDDEVSFNDILNQSDNDWKYLALIGYPGSGKTTLAKRLGRSKTIKLSFLLDIKNLNFSESKLTLRQLLLEHAYQELPDKKGLCSYDFEWIIDNQSKVAVIIDGFDQFNWKLNPKSPSFEYETPQKVEDLISNLCRKHYLPDVHLIITSRPHSLLTLPEMLRPKITLFVKDLKFDDMKRLFFAFAQDKAEEIWDKINKEFPQLLDFCLNPMMLQFCIQACLRLSTGIRGSTALTQIFASLNKNLSSIDNTRNKHLDTIQEQLGVVAFKATMASTVVITIEQLKNEHLTMEEVQDLIIAVQGYQGYTSTIFDEDIDLYFSHKLLQEYFTAYHIVEKHLFSNHFDMLRSRFFSSQWKMVRKFVSGLLVGTGIQAKDIEKTPDSKLNQKCEVVQALVDINHLGITEEMAKAAVQQNSEFPLDEGDCLLNCIEWMESRHEGDNTKVRDLAKQFDNEIAAAKTVSTLETSVAITSRKTKVEVMNGGAALIEDFKILQFYAAPRESKKEKTTKNAHISEKKYFALASRPECAEKAEVDETPSDFYTVERHSSIIVALYKKIISFAICQYLYALNKSSEEKKRLGEAQSIEQPTMESSDIVTSIKAKEETMNETALNEDFEEKNFGAAPWESKEKKTTKKSRISEENHFTSAARSESTEKLEVVEILTTAINCTDAKQHLEKGLNNELQITIDVGTIRKIVYLEAISRCFFEINILADEKQLLGKAINMEQPTMKTSNIVTSRKTAKAKKYETVFIEDFKEFYVAPRESKKEKNTNKKILNKAQNFEQPIPIDVFTYNNIACIVQIIDQCFVEIDTLTDAEEHLEKALNVQQQLLKASALYRSGLCLIEMNEVTDPIEYFKKYYFVNNLLQWMWQNLLLMEMSLLAN